MSLAELGPRVPTENTTLALVLDTLENRVSCCLARCIGGMATAGLLRRSELVGFAGVPATPALGDCPHLIKDRGRCAASPVSFRSRHRETSRHGKRPRANSHAIIRGTGIDVLHTGALGWLILRRVGFWGPSHYQPSSGDWKGLPEIWENNHKPPRRVPVLECWQQYGVIVGLSDK